MTTLDNSYRACRSLVREANSNFAWTFHVLPRQKRLGMEALYAFARRTDDLSDSLEPVDAKRAALRQWRASVEAALAGDCRDPLLPAIVDAVQRFQIPPQHLFEIVEGVERDLLPIAHASYEDLRDYCYLVASAVGLACIHIWGYSDRAVYGPAVECGVAFQMANILRDLSDDLKQGRCYLPSTDLEECGLAVGDLLQIKNRPAIEKLLQLQFDRVQMAFDEGAKTAGFLSTDGQRVFTLMFGTYRGLFNELERRGVGILRERVRLGWRTKLAIAARSIF